MIWSRFRTVLISQRTLLKTSATDPITAQLTASRHSEYILFCDFISQLSFTVLFPPHTIFFFLLLFPIVCPLLPFTLLSSSASSLSFSSDFYFSLSSPIPFIPLLFILSTSSSSPSYFHVLPSLPSYSSPLPPLGWLSSCFPSPYPLPLLLLLPLFSPSQVIFYAGCHT